MLQQYTYTDKELTTLLDSLVILVDTREKKNEHLTFLLSFKGIAKVERGNFMYPTGTFFVENEGKRIYLDGFEEYFTHCDECGKLMQIEQHFIGELMHLEDVLEDTFVTCDICTDLKKRI